MPVAEVPVNEQDDQGQDHGEDLSGRPNVIARQEGQGQHPVQDEEQLQSDFPPEDVVQISQTVLFAVLEGIGLGVQRNNKPGGRGELSQIGRALGLPRYMAGV